MATIEGVSLTADGLRWPPQCCVPAFLYAAIRELGIPFDKPEQLPAMLGVRVVRNDANPLGLLTAETTLSAGISAANAAKAIEIFLRNNATTLRFRHIRLCEITLGLWEDVLREALRRNVIVGIGVDYSVLSGRQSDERSLHVFRVSSIEQSTLTLSDDSGECEPRVFDVPWYAAEHATVAANDGLWLIGSVLSLKLPYTLPYPEDD